MAVGPGDSAGQLRWLSGEVVASLLHGPELVEPIAQALVSYSSGAASSPPRAGAAAPGGWLAAMPAYLPDRTLSAKLISVFPANTAAGQPPPRGIVALFDAADGRPLCVMAARHITA